VESSRTAILNLVGYTKHLESIENEVVVGDSLEREQTDWLSRLSETCVIG